jgi:plasmid rolling circle replication initiator protein Rep
MCGCDSDHQAAKPRLGIKAKSSPTSKGADQDKDEQKQILRAIRRERFELSRIARGIFAHEGEKAKLKHVLNYHRAAKCSYIAIGEVALHRSVEYQKSFFTGLFTCGSVWACPNCAAKIQERRRVEIATAMDHMYEHGKKAVMVTLTFPHSKRNNLQGLLDAQKQAFVYLRKGRVWDLFKQRVGYNGLIRSLEITYGENGWHPHTHELWFVDSTANAKYIKEFILRQWEAACIKAGLLDPTRRNKLSAFRKHSVDVKDNCSTSEYLAKQDDSRNWGVDREIAKASTKTGKSKGMHPFGFLSHYGKEKNSKWSRLWVEYNRAFKGKAQLFWSRGLKDECGVNNLSDEELAAVTEDEAIEIMKLTQKQWDKIKSTDSQSLILDVAEETTDKKVIESVIENAKVKNLDIAELVQKRVRLQNMLFEESIRENQIPVIDTSKVRFIPATDEFLKDFKESLIPDEESAPMPAPNKPNSDGENGQMIFNF